MGREKVVRVALARRLGRAGFGLIFSALAGVLGARPVAAQLPNLVPNAEFDTDTAGWTNTAGISTLSWSVLDQTNCSGLSGSGLLNSTTPASNQIVGAVVCVPALVDAGAIHSYGVWIRFTIGQATSGVVTLRGFWSQGPGCTGMVSGEEFEAEVSSSTAGEWVQIRDDALLPPGGAQSFALNVRLTKTEAGGSLNLRIDGAHFVARPGFLFADAFELGSLCRWTSQSP